MDAIRSNSMAKEIRDALIANGVAPPMVEGGEGFDKIYVGSGVTFIIIEHYATTPEAAEALAETISPLLAQLRSEGGKAMVITKDLWWRERKVLLPRMLSHCGVFTRISGRNCEVRRIGRPLADEFMNLWHNYGTASCRHCYGIYAKGEMVAAAEFSNSRKWIKAERQVLSYEWVRYASLPNIRVDGGMGKALHKFVEEVSPDDIMSYADLEWSDGGAYRSLGFKEDGVRAGVMFRIDPVTMQRVPLNGSRKSALPLHSPANGIDLFYRNFGSIKYRLRL